MSISSAQLTAVMPDGAKIATSAGVDQWRDALNAAMQKFEINTNARVAGFLAQIAVESGELEHLSENLNYRAESLVKVFPHEFPTAALAAQYEHKQHAIADRVYANRLGNGDEASGDGWTYRGRGLIQLTGKDNYTDCGVGIGDAMLVACPDRLLTKTVAALSAAWFYSSRGCNELADNEDIDAISHRINGSGQELLERRNYYARAKLVLSA